MLRFFVFGGTCLAIIAVVLTAITKVWVNIYAKYKEKSILDQKIISLKEEEEKLAVDVERLQDPEYIARHLREKYFYTKEGEYVIILPED